TYRSADTQIVAFLAFRRQQGTSPVFVFSPRIKKPRLNPDLVLRDEHNEIYSVRYDAVKAMLLNEFLKEHRTVAEQETKVAEQQNTIAELKTTLAQQQKQIEALNATVQKVSNQLELNKSGSQVVVSNQ